MTSLAQGLLAAALLVALPAQTRGEDAMLSETVGFMGAIAYVGMGTPAYVLAAVRHGEVAFAGFGEASDGSGKAPTADTMMRVGSVSKVFCGQVLASLVADGSTTFAAPLQRYLPQGWTAPEKDGRAVRLIDLVTHSAGFPREAPFEFGPNDDPFASNNAAAQEAGLKLPLLYAPGTGMLYSNYGYDLLGAALGQAGSKPYAELLRERVLAPLGMDSTRFTPLPEDDARLMQGHDFVGAALPFAPTPTTIECAGGLYTTASDMLKWISWHVSEAPPDEVRLLDHAAYLYRDGLVPAFGFDEGGGEMDAMGLGWVVMMPTENRPLILHKTGGLHGMFAYVAIAPTRGVGVFTAINEMKLGAAETMIDTAIKLITEISPR